MEITSISLMIPKAICDNLRAYATITIDNMIMIHDIRLIEKEGVMFIAMPNRHRHKHCKNCNYKNPVDGRFCTQCGKSLPPYVKEIDGRITVDTVHPIHNQARDFITDAIIAAYTKQQRSAHEAGAYSKAGT